MSFFSPPVLCERMDPFFLRPPCVLSLPLLFLCVVLRSRGIRVIGMCFVEMCVSLPFPLPGLSAFGLAPFLFAIILLARFRTCTLRSLRVLRESVWAYSQYVVSSMRVTLGSSVRMVSLRSQRRLSLDFDFWALRNPKLST